MGEKSCQPEVTHALVGESYWKTEETNRGTRITMFTVAAQQDVSNEKTQRKTTPLSYQHLPTNAVLQKAGSWLLLPRNGAHSGSLGAGKAFEDLVVSSRAGKVNSEAASIDYLRGRTCFNALCSGQGCKNTFASWKLAFLPLGVHPNAVFHLSFHPLLPPDL